MKKLIRWFLSPSKKSSVDSDSLFSKLLVLEERIVALEQENVETSNCLYELSNCIDAVDARIDILTLEDWTRKNV